MSVTRSSPLGTEGDKFEALIAEFEDLGCDVKPDNARVLEPSADIMYGSASAASMNNSSTLSVSSYSSSQVVQGLSTHSDAALAAVNSQLADSTANPHPHVLRIVWDADGCAYNANYRRAIFFFIEEFKEQIDRLVNISDAAEKERSIDRLLNALYEKLNQNIYQSKSQDEFDQVYNRLKEFSRTCVMRTLASLNLTREQVATMLGGDVSSERWKLLRAHIYSLGNESANRCFQHLELDQCLHWIMNVYLDLLNKISDKFIRFIFSCSNIKLVEHVTDVKSHFDKVVLMVGSNRQSYQDDLNCSWLNSTSSIFVDLHNFLPVLKKIFGNENASIDTVTMADIQNHLSPGESYSRILSHSNEHANYYWDESKGSMIYAFCHRAAEEYIVASGGTRLVSDGIRVTVKFIDDRLDIINGLYRLYSTRPDLLPPGLVLELLHYDGNIHDSYRIVGTGSQVDHDYMRSAAMMSEFCDSFTWDGYRPMFDSVKSFMNETTVNKFLDRREWEKQRLSSSSASVSPTLSSIGSAAFFAPVDLSKVKMKLAAAGGDDDICAIRITQGL